MTFQFLSNRLYSILLWPWRVFYWAMYARPIRFTRFGWFYLVVVLGIGAAAINTGNNLLYLILGILLGFIVVSGILSDSGLWGIDIDWHPLETLYAGKAAEFEVALHKTTFPGMGIRLEATWKNHRPTTHPFFWIPRKTTQTQRFTMKPARRGYLILEHVRILSFFPFGLFEKFHTISFQSRYLVYPHCELLPSHERPLVDRRREESRTPALQRGKGGSPYEIRPFREGDSPKRMDWKASAKRNTWFVKEMEEEATPTAFDFIAHWPEEHELDRFIDFVASWYYTAFQQNEKRTLYTSGLVFPVTTKQELEHVLAYLALFKPSSTMAPVAQRRGIDLFSLWKQRHA